MLPITMHYLGFVYALVIKRSIFSRSFVALVDTMDILGCNNDNRIQYMFQNIEFTGQMFKFHL